MSKNKLIWRTEIRKVADLVVWSKNPRTITKSAMNKLKQRIKERGFHAVIVIDTDNTVLSGNQRKVALEEINVKEITVLVPNRKLTEKERDAIALESNSNDGEWDFEALKSFDLSILTDIGFDSVELSNIWNETIESTDDDFDVDKEIKKIKETSIKRGDLIILGQHKLLCADSTDSLAVKKLFGEDRASVIYCDSPYNINLSYDKGVGNKSNYGGNVDDNKLPEEYKDFIRKVMKNTLSVAEKDTHCFWWCDEAWVWVFQTLFLELGVKNRRLNIWLKNNSSPCPTTAFNKAIEVCCYGTIGSPFLSSSLKNLNEIMNKELGTGNELFDDVTNVLAVKRMPSNQLEHPTSKPISLHEKPIKRCSKVGDIIFDAFSGSASTMLCAEQLKRRVYSIEMSEIFCELAIRRWEKATSKKVKIIKNYYEEK